MSKQTQSSEDAPSWLQTEAVWERITKSHPYPEKAMDRLMDLVHADIMHRHDQERSARRREWARWWLQLVRVLLGFGAFLLIAYVAVLFLRAQAPTQGMVILLTGSVPITALFLSGRPETPPRVPAGALVPAQPGPP